MSASFTDGDAAPITGPAQDPASLMNVEPPESVKKIEEPASPGGQPDEQAAREFSQEQIKEAIQKNGDMQFGSHTINFGLDEETGRVVITVADSESDEVIRQIPPKDYLDFVARFKELFGLMLDETA